MIDIENLSDLELDELQAKYEKIKVECIDAPVPRPEEPAISGEEPVGNEGRPYGRPYSSLFGRSVRYEIGSGLVLIFPALLRRKF